MEIQEMHDSNQSSIQQMLKDPKKCRKIMMILIQTLYNLGYKQSAKQLQQESGITFVTKQLQKISDLLDQQQHFQVVNLIDLIKSQWITSQIKQKIKQMIYESQCLKLIIQGNLQASLKIVDSFITDQVCKQKICQIIVLSNNQQLSGGYLKRKNQEIFAYLLKQFQQIGPNQIDKVIQSYTQNNKKSDGKRNIKSLFNLQKQYPPNRLLTSQQSTNFDKSISHIKINETKKCIVCVSQNKSQKQISIFQVNVQNINSQKAFKNNNVSMIRSKYSIFTLKKKTKLNNMEHFGQRQAIQSIQYQNQTIVLCTYAFVIFLNEELQQIRRVVSQQKAQRSLFIQFNSLSKLIYCCGYYTRLLVYDKTGQQINQIQPFPKTRKFVFTKQNILIGASCTMPRIFRYNIQEQKMQIEKEVESTVMDICYHPLKQIIAISTFKNLSIINSITLQTIYKCLAPDNPHKVLIQLSFYGSYLISLCRNFKAYKSSDNMTSFFIQKQWPGEGVFDIMSQSIMISGNKQLLCWSQGNIDYERQQSDSSSEEQNEYIDAEQQSVDSNQQMNEEDNSESDIDLDLS